MQFSRQRLVGQESTKIELISIENSLINWNAETVNQLSNQHTGPSSNGAVPLCLISLFYSIIEMRVITVKVVTYPSMSTKFQSITIQCNFILPRQVAPNFVPVCSRINQSLGIFCSIHKKIKKNDAANIVQALNKKLSMLRFTLYKITFALAQKTQTPSIT